jgi:hypothetical protein
VGAVVIDDRFSYSLLLGILQDTFNVIVSQVDSQMAGGSASDTLMSDHAIFEVFEASERQVAFEV